MIKILKSKEELNLGFALRIEVFVKEQKVPMELEFDEKDNSENTVHIGFFDNNKLIGVARLIDKEYRGQGIGRELIIGCENIAQQILKRKIIIELSAQIQAENFYKSLGYNRVNDIIYLDAGIEHVDMRKEIN